MHDPLYLLLATTVMFGVTYALRGFSFMAFGNGRKTPEAIQYVGRVISPAVIAVMIVYCLKGTSFHAPLYGGAEAAAIGVCILLHRLFRNPLLSIAVSTAVYMLMVQNWGALP